MGCYELARFPSRDAMIDELMTIYATRPTLNLPPFRWRNPAATTSRKMEPDPPRKRVAQ